MSEPIQIISLGAGVQSSTMALMAAAGEITPLPVAAVFADTQDEPVSVYAWLDWLEMQLPFPVIRVSKGVLSDYLTRQYYSTKNKKITVGGFPAFVKNPDGTTGLMSRQCTRDFKIDPVNKVLTQLMRKHKTRACVKWLGMSLEEIYRMKPARRTTVTHRWPLIELRMTRHDCLSWMKSRGYPKPPRSACIYCPYRGNAEWRDLPPEEFQKPVAFERRVQAAHHKGSMVGVPFLHRSLVPLDKVDLSTDTDRGQGLLNGFNNECEGMCGV